MLKRKICGRKSKCGIVSLGADGGEGDGWSDGVMLLCSV